MNQRILEIAFKLFDEDDQSEPGTYIQLNVEKFAELIVRECIDIAQDRANFPGFPPNDVNDIINEIREHFGVEE